MLEKKFHINIIIWLINLANTNNDNDDELRLKCPAENNE